MPRTVQKFVVVWEIAPNLVLFLLKSPLMFDLISSNELWCPEVILIQTKSLDPKQIFLMLLYIITDDVSVICMALES